jgi:hypothetical protein
MKRRTVQWSVTCFLSLVAGIVIGRMPSGDAPARPIAAERERKPEPTTDLRTTADFLAHLRAYRENGDEPGHSSIHGFTEGWSDAELRAALEEALKEPGMLFEPGTALLGSIFSEYLLRDFDAGLAWFDGLDMRKKSSLSGRLAEAWPEGRMEEGLDYMARIRDIASRGFSDAIAARCLTDAAAKGVEATASILARLEKEQVLPYFQATIAFPRGFDFDALFATDQLKGANPGFTNLLLTSWFVQDRAAAFRWALEHKGASSLIHFALPRSQSTPEAISWVGGQLGGLSPDQRREFLDQMQREGDYQFMDLLPILTGAQDPASRTEVRDRLLQGVFTGRLEEAVGALEDLPTPADRIRSLESIAPSAISTPFKAGISPDGESLLRRKLQAWNATEPQIETILKRLKSTE